MENQPKSISAHALTWGAITAVVLIVYSLLLFITNLYMNKALGYVNYAIMIAGMAWGALQYRKLYSNGFLSYGKAFSASFMIGLVASVISIIYFFIYIKFINTNMITEMLEQTRQQMEANANGMSPEQMDKALEMTTKFMQPAWMMVFGLLMYVIASAIFGAIIAIFVKKEDPSINPIA